MIVVEAAIVICSATKSAAGEKAVRACRIPHTVTHLEDAAGVASSSLNLRHDCASCKACQNDEAFPAARANAA